MRGGAPFASEWSGKNHQGTKGTKRSFFDEWSGVAQFLAGCSGGLNGKAGDWFGGCDEDDLEGAFGEHAWEWN